MSNIYKLQCPCCGSIATLNPKYPIGTEVYWYSPYGLERVTIVDIRMTKEGLEYYVRLTRSTYAFWEREHMLDFVVSHDTQKERIEVSK